MPSHRTIQRLAAAVAVPVAATLLASLACCTVGPNYTSPGRVVAGGYVAAAPATQPTSRPSSVTTEVEPGPAWWTTLNDPELDKLVRRAAAGNLSLQRIGLRLADSRASLRIAGAKELPTLGAAGQFVRINSGQNVGLASLSSSGSAGTAARSTSINTNIWTTSFDTSWEIDVFGGNRRQIEAAAADYQAAVEDRRDGLVSLTAEVARDYLQLRGTQQRLRIARNNLGLENDTLGLTQSLRKAGFNSELDVSRAKTQVSQTRATIVPLNTQASQQEHAIATLLGLSPGDLQGELDPQGPVPTVPSVVGVGLPADLLRRRPDVRRAERQIAAANARVGAAIADFYPKFSLTGNFGLDSTKFSHLFDWSSRYFLLYPSISWRLFDFGSTQAGVDQEKARYQQAVLVYQDTILTGLREVEDALVAYGNEQDHRAALADAVTSAQESVAIARDQYKQGVIDFLQVLDAQRQLLSAQDELAQSDQTIATNLVALYKALGGGWEDEAIRQRETQPNADVPQAIPVSALANGGGGDVKTQH